MTTMFPSVILQQQVNSVSTRHIQPDGHGAFDFVWTHFGFADDSEEMTRRRLRQANLFGPAGFVSADDGEVIELSQQGFEQKPFHRTLSRTGRHRRRRHRPHGHRDTDPRHVPLLARGDGGAEVHAADLRWTSPATKRWSSSMPSTPTRSTPATGTLARVLRRRVQLPAGAAREPRARPAARDLVVREQGHAEGSRLRHPRDAVPRSLLPAPRRRRAAGARAPRVGSRARRTTRSFAPSSTS